MNARKIPLTLAGLGLALAAAGCAAGGPGLATSADTASPAAAGGNAKPAAAQAPAHLGQPITLTGQAEGSKLTVTAVKVVDPAKGADEFTAADPGNRLVSVQFKVVNAGTAAYEDSPSNGAKVVDTQGQQFDSTIGSTTAGPAFPASVKIPPGGNGLGFITFQVPKASTVAKVQFGMDSGFGQSGEWAVH